jgi:hypothetical protein
MTFLQPYHKDGDEFLSHIVGVAGDKTWISFVNVETKEQTKQWMHTHPPNKPEKLKQILSARKLVATLFWVRKGVLKVKFMHQGSTMSEVCCEILRKLCRAIQNKRRGMLLHDNGRPHSADRTRALQELSTRSCLTTLLRALISLQATTIRLPTWRSGWDHSTLTVMSWWKMSKLV